MGQCCVGCKKEFQLKNFGFHGVHPGRFISFQWRWPVGLFLLYRFILALYTDFWFIYTAKYMNEQDGNRTTANENSTFVLYSFPVYLTNWTYLLLALYLNVSAVVAGFYIFRNSIPLFSRCTLGQHRQMFHEFRTEPSFWDGDYDFVPGSNEVVTKTQLLPWYFKLSWILFNAATVGSLIVTIVFFVFLWPQFSSSGIDLLNLQLHGLNSVIIFMEHCLNAIPYRMLHFLYAFIYTGMYLIFSAIFYAAGNKIPIYPKVLDWNNAGQTMIMVCLVGIIVLPLVQFFFFIIYKLKTALLNHLSEGESAQLQHGTRNDVKF